MRQAYIWFRIMLCCIALRSIGLDYADDEVYLFAYLFVC